MFELAPSSWALVCAARASASSRAARSLASATSAPSSALRSLALAVDGALQLGDLLAELRPFADRSLQLGLELGAAPLVRLGLRLGDADLLGVGDRPLLVLRRLRACLGELAFEAVGLPRCLDLGALEL